MAGLILTPKSCPAVGGKTCVFPWKQGSWGSKVTRNKLKKNKAEAISAELLELNWKVQLYNPVLVAFQFLGQLSFGDISVWLIYKFWEFFL